MAQAFCGFFDMEGTDRFVRSEMSVYLDRALTKIFHVSIDFVAVFI